MSAVSETIVREYFELHGFFVRQQRKYAAPNRREDEEIDFFVIHPRPIPQAEPRPFILNSADLPSLARAVVAVKGWHTETFSPAVLSRAPEIFRFAEPAVFEAAARAFGAEGPLPRILVVPALPNDRDTQTRSIELLRSKGIDGVIPFHTMLADLIHQTEVNRNYQKSDLLQMIRILKNYGFFREPQLELFKARRKPRVAKADSPPLPPPSEPSH